MKFVVAESHSPLTGVNVFNVKSIIKGRDIVSEQYYGLMCLIEVEDGFNINNLDVIIPPNSSYQIRPRTLYLDNNGECFYNEKGKKKKLTLSENNEAYIAFNALSVQMYDKVLEYSKLKFDKVKYSFECIPLPNPFKIM